MKCYQCATQLPEGTKSCPVCGKNQVFTPRLLQAAMDSDQEAISQLYNRTYNAVYQTVKSMIRDEDTVLDIVQDAYVRGFQNLDQLRSPELFPAWMKQIAANTAKNWLKRKKPVLFSELENEDGDMTLDFEDDRTDNLPEAVMDQKETTRLVNEILDSLSEEQRIVVGLFYYQQLSVKEIADMLDCSENTVKSRLNYARKKIKVQVEDLERRGTKLYSLAPIPFMLWLFRGMQTQAAELPDPAVLEAVQAECAGLSSGGASAGAAAKAGSAGAKAAAGTAGKALAAKIAAGVAAVAILGGGAAAVLPAITRQETEPSPQIVETMGELPADAGEAAELPAAEPEETAAPEEEEESSPAEAALEQYRVIVSQADSYSFGSAEPTGVYRYALVQLQPEDPVPTLLLARETEDFGSYIRVFQYDPETKTVRQPEETLRDGVALRGGFRGSLAMAKDGNGIITSNFDSTTWDERFYRATLEGDSLQTAPVWEGKMGDPIPEELQTTEIEWRDIGDFRPLGGSQDLPSEETAGEEALPEDGDRIVFRGTLHTYSYDELLDMLGYADPNAGWTDATQTYRIILLDEPQAMRLFAYGMMGPQEGTAYMIDVSRAEGLEEYDGQHLIFSIDPDEAYWPSDTSLPLGEPRAKDVHVLQ